MRSGSVVPGPGGTLNRIRRILTNLFGIAGRPRSAHPGSALCIAATSPVASFPLRILIIACLMSSCRQNLNETPRTLPQGLSWCGRSASLIRDSVPADTSAPDACLGVHLLEFPGAEGAFHLELREYRASWLAYAALQRRGGGRAVEEGCIRLDSGWGFIHGRYLGLADSSSLLLTREEFRQNLVFGGQIGFSLPPEFEAFPILGRITGSERVFEADFLGMRWNGPIFSVGYRCHGDTALAFRGYTQNEDSLLSFIAPWEGRREILPRGRGWRFQGKDEFGRPLFLGYFSEGILGFSGCYDSSWNREFVEKMQKMRMFWSNP